MISIETRKLILKIILVCVLHSDFTDGRYTNKRLLYIGKCQVNFCVFFLTLCKSAACGSNKQLYTEIGCKPIYDNNERSCPVAYSCGNINSLSPTYRHEKLTIFFCVFDGLFRTENVFTRPGNKCYFNGNVYEPSARLSEADSALNPCLAACFCDQRQYNKYDDKTYVIFYIKLKPIITR